MAEKSTGTEKSAAGLAGGSGNDRATLLLSLSVEDKIKLKTVAARSDGCAAGPRVDTGTW